MWIVIDDNGTVISTCSEPLEEGIEVETDLTFEDIAEHPLGWKYIKGKLVYDETTETERITALGKIREINILKQDLADTDYAVIKSLEQILYADSLVSLLKALKDGATEYKQLLADRKSWRERIKELEKWTT